MTVVNVAQEKVRTYLDELDFGRLPLPPVACSCPRAFPVLCQPKHVCTHMVHQREEVPGLRITGSSELRAAPLADATPEMALKTWASLGAASWDMQPWGRTAGRAAHFQVVQMLVKMFVRVPAMTSNPLQARGKD